jgi:hypothetical protein
MVREQADTVLRIRTSQPEGCFAEEVTVAFTTDPVNLGLGE